MSDVCPLPPVWAAEATLRAVWVEVGESAEWVAARTQALLLELSATLDVPHWQTSKASPWEGELAALGDIVRGFAVTGMFGDPEPESGFIFTVSGEGPLVSVQVRVTAGATTHGRRVPRHSLTVQFRQLATGGMTSGRADTVCEAVARTWEPSMLTLSDSAVNSLARRGNWKIGVGYRTWINTEVGEVTDLADGLTSMTLAGGTLVSAPDDWSAERVVAALTKTLAVNGLDEIPH